MKKLALASALITLAAVSQAAYLVDQGPATGPYGGGWQDITGGQILADSFTLSTTATATEYDFYGVLSAPAPSYTLVLYADSGSNAPGATLLTLGSLTPTTFGLWGQQTGTNIYEATFTGLNITLLGGVKYWIDVSGNGSDAGCGSTNPSSNGDGTLSFESSPAGPWNTISSIGDLTYQLQSSAVPEPMSMLALGIGAVALLRKRARR